jgi:hypothetical protein
MTSSALQEVGLDGASGSPERESIDPERSSLSTIRY